MEWNLTFRHARSLGRLRRVIEQRLGGALERFRDQLSRREATIIGRADGYRARLAVQLADGRSMLVVNDHRHPLGAVAGALDRLRRNLAEQSRGLQSEDRRDGLLARGKAL